MKYTVIFMDLAEQDYEKIVQYLAHFYEGTVAKFLDALEEIAGTLETMPRAFEKYAYNSNYRRAPLHDYLVFYKIKEDEKVVQIHRILHGARNIRQFLGGE